MSELFDDEHGREWLEPEIISNEQHRENLLNAGYQPEKVQDLRDVEADQAFNDQHGHLAPPTETEIKAAGVPLPSQHPARG
jgi:hypothetical protein